MTSSGTLQESAPLARPASSPRKGEKPRVLLATTGQLASTARLAMELHDAGVAVSLISARNQPARVLTFLTRWYRYSASGPVNSLQRAIRKGRPDLVIPCDERTVRDLHHLWRSTLDPTVRLIVEQSVGAGDIFPVVQSRHALLSLAKEVGVPVPDSAPVANEADLDAWMADHPMPLVMKADGSWAGFGVKIVSTAAEARAMFPRMRKPIGLRLALREAVLEGDPFGLRAWAKREAPAISVQSFVDGHPANIGVACWKGEVLASIGAEAVATESATGPSTAARVIDSPAMLEAAQKVVAKLGISGLVGFDFMVETATGRAYMIEMNPRTTPICAVRLAAPQDLAEALAARLGNRAVKERIPRTLQNIIVFFPDTWRNHPSSHFLQVGYHDVPWEQPELVRRLVKQELRERYWIMRQARKLWLRATANSAG